MLGMLASGDAVSDATVAAVCDAVFDDILTASDSMVMHTGMQFVDIIDAKAALEDWDPDSDEDFHGRYKV